jgi:hypothetical protein
MRRALPVVLFLSAVALAGCQSATQTQVYVTGPASAPTEAFPLDAASVPVPVSVPARAPTSAPSAARASAPLPLPAPMQTPVQVVASTPADTCGAAQYQALVGGPSAATLDLPIPGTSRHYGSEEAVATDTPTRLNFVHSGTAIESVTNPASTILRVFCG